MALVAQPAGNATDMTRSKRHASDGVRGVAAESGSMLTPNSQPSGDDQPPDRYPSAWATRILARLPLCHSGQSPGLAPRDLALPRPDRLLEGAAAAVVPSRRDAAAGLTRRCVWPSMPLTRAGSLDPREVTHVHCGSGLLGRPASESGRLRQGADGHPGGDRRRSVLMLPTLGCNF